MESLGDCLWGFAIDVILAWNLVREVEAKVLNFSVADDVAVVELSLNLRGALDGGLLDDQVQNVKMVNFLGLLLEPDLILGLRVVVVPSLSRNDAVVVLDHMLKAHGPSPSFDYLGPQSLNTYFEANSIRLLSKMTRIVLLTVINASALIVQAYAQSTAQKQDNNSSHQQFYYMNSKHLVLVFLALVLSTALKMNMADAQKAFKTVFCQNCQNCQFNLNSLNISQAGFFNLSSITNNSMNVTQIDIEIFNIPNSTYTFPGLNISNSGLQAVVFYPNIAQILGVIIYYHPTLFGRLQVPTALGPVTSALGALYASQGYVVVFINYLGQSQNSNITIPHPYILYGTTIIQSGIYALRQIVLNLYQRYRSTSFKLFSCGYSEGSVYSLLMQHCLRSGQCFGQNTNLDSFYAYKGAAGLSGPYDLSQIVYQFLIKEVGLVNEKNYFRIEDQYLTNLGKPGLLAMTLRSYLFFSKYRKQLKDILQPSFYAMTCGKLIKPEHCLGPFPSKYNINQALLSFQQSQKIATAIGFSAFGKSVSFKEYLGQLLEEYTLQENNSIKSLVKDIFFVDSNFTSVLQQVSNQVNQKPKYPTYVWFLEKDSLVSMLNSKRYIDQNKIPSSAYYEFNNSNYRVCRGKEPFRVDHLGAQLLSNIFALQFFKTN